MNKSNFLRLGGVLLLAACLLVTAVPARAEMYVEAYMGGVQGANTGMDVTSNHPGAFGGIVYRTAEFHSIPGKLSPAFMGGLKIGTWFVKDGFLGCNYPDWMKYLGFYLDFSYHRLDFPRQNGKTIAVDNLVGGSALISNNFFSEGTAATLAFMFAARYGFLPDSEVPFGRLQPYVAVGPAILFTSQRPSLTSNTYFSSPVTYTPYGISRDSQSSTNIALAVEAGIRWMCLKNVSLDLSFKYRYAAPSYTYNYIDPLDNTFQSMTLNPTYNLFSGQVGAAYHF